MIKKPQRTKIKAEKNVRALLSTMMKEKEPYKTKVCGLTFLVHPNVFSPKYAPDTEIFAESISIQPGESFLEIGPGTGAISVIAAIKGARKVVAIDVSAAAVANTKANAKLHQVDKVVKAFNRDVYSPLKPTDKFDTIFWNVPFMFAEKGKELSDIERTVFDSGYQSIEKFVRDAKKHLNKGGRILLGFSKTLGHFSIIAKMLADEGYKTREITETAVVKYGKKISFRLFESIKLPKT